MELGKRGELVFIECIHLGSGSQKKVGKRGPLCRCGWGLLAGMWQTEFYKVHKYFDGGSKLSFYFYNNINR